MNGFHGLDWCGQGIFTPFNCINHLLTSTHFTQLQWRSSEPCLLPPTCRPLVCCQELIIIREACFPLFSLHKADGKSILHSAEVPQVVVMTCLAREGWWTAVQPCLNCPVARQADVGHARTDCDANGYVVVSRQSCTMNERLACGMSTP